MPAQLSFEEAAPSTEGSHYALALLRKAKVGSGQDVLVYGEGVLAPDPDRQAPAALRLQEHDDVVVLAVMSDAADVADPHVEEVSVGGGWPDVLLRTTRRERRGWSPDAIGARVGEGLYGQRSSTCWSGGACGPASRLPEMYGNFSTVSSHLRRRSSSADTTPTAHSQPRCQWRRP
jgi:hypothetical protein